MAHVRKEVVDYLEEDALNIYIDGSCASKLRRPARRTQPPTGSRNRIARAAPGVRPSKGAQGNPLRV
jgi:hypothetical protein